jgi:hypothetical protein
LAELDDRPHFQMAPPALLLQSKVTMNPAAPQPAANSAENSVLKEAIGSHE